jgi:hypothetical protein
MSFDDKYVFVTHNRLTNGTFTILDASNGVVFFQSADLQQLLSPPGIFFSPSQGNYEGGEGNTHDLVVYANRPSLNDEEVTVGSATYAFQFPIGFTGAKVGVNVKTLLNHSDFQTYTPPLITNQGNSMFWGVSRSKVNGWMGIGFDRDAGGNNIGYGRGDPPSLPILSEITMGMKVVSPNLYTGTAGSAFAAISTVGDSMTPLWNISTSSPIYAKSHVTTHNGSELVFFIEELGKAYLLEGNTGKQIWSFMASDGRVLGNFAMNLQGTTVYFGDSNGKLTAWQIVEASAINNLTTTVSPSSSVSSPGNSGPSTTPVSILPTAGSPVASTPTAVQAPFAFTPTAETGPIASSPSPVGAPNALNPTAGGAPYALTPTAGGAPYALNPTAGGAPYALNPTAGGAPYSLNSTDGGPVTNTPTVGAPFALNATTSSAVPVVDTSLNPGVIASPAPIPTASGVTPTATTPRPTATDTFPPETAPALLTPGNPTATKVPTVSSTTDKPSSTSSGYVIKLHVVTLCSYALFLLI